MIRPICKFLYLFVLIAAFVSTVWCQTSNGTIVGNVTDKSGGTVAGARITVTSILTGAERDTTTNPEGTYRIDSVAPGTYNVTASASGYATVTNSSLVVPASSIITSDVVLTIGQASQVVEVKADNTAINTANGEISGTLGDVELSNLPIGSLSPYELAVTLPGVTTDEQNDRQTNGFAFISGGDRPRGNNFLIEGQDNNDAGITGQGIQPENLEAQSEVKILQDNYTAEFGHGGGSVSNLILKSGTNNFHGAVYWRTENSSLDAIDKQDHINGVTTKTKYRENLPGFRIGGPIIHDKLFFFGSYQWDAYRSTANEEVLPVPTAAGIATLKALPSNPRVAALLQAYGSLVGTVNVNNQQPSIPLGPDPTTGVNRGTVQVGTVQRYLGSNDDSPELDLTGDYLASQKDTLRLHLIRTHIIVPLDTFSFPGQLPGFDTDQDGTSYNAGIAETHVFSSRLLNEARISYGRIGITFGLPASTLANPLYNQPAVIVSGLNASPNTATYGIPNNMPQERFHNTYQLQDTMTWTRGQHVFKAGADVFNIRVKDLVPFLYYGTINYSDDTAPTPYPGGGTFTYRGLANLVDDYGGPSTDAVEQNFGNPAARPNIYSQNYFVEDIYKPTSDVSIDVGFRYEYNGAPFNAVGTKYPGIDLSNIGCYPTAANPCNSAEQADKSEWGPRLGLAYSPDLYGGYKTAVRSGFGIFYDPIFSNIIDNIQASAPNNALPIIHSTATASNNRGTANWAEQFANLNKSPLATNTAEPIKNNLAFPRVLHWNLSLEQEIPWSSSISVSYIGERGEHLYGNSNVNPYVNDYLSLARVYPNRGQIIVRDNSGDSVYHALWAQFDHKISQGLLFRASYTYSKMLDDSSEIFTFNNESSYPFGIYPTPRKRTDWGPSAYDHRQRLVLSYVYQPPVWHTEGAAKVAGNVVNHWSIAGITQFQTGTPENVEDGSAVNPLDADGDGISNDRPIIGNPKAPLKTYAFDDSWFYGVSDGGLCSGPSLWYTSDPCHVVTPSQVHWIIPAYGVHPPYPVGRNALYSPGYQLWDMNISRSFRLYENATLDFRSEFFNIFNHGNPGLPYNGISGVAHTSLIDGINNDQFNNDPAVFGTDTFADNALTVSGHRHVRFVVRIAF